MQGSVTFVVPGKPYAQKRARSGYVKALNRAVTYDHPDNKSFAETVRAIAIPHFPAPFEGPVRTRIVAVFEPPPSWSKRKRAAALAERYHTQKPDRDNLEKAALDALKRIAWADDAQVADGSCTKLWGEKAETRITVEPLIRPASGEGAS